MRFELHRVSETGDELLAAAYALASAERRKKIRSLRREEDKRQCLCADHWLRALLSEVTGLSASELIFAAESGGKPVLTNAAVHFSLSHSGDFVLCAVDDRPIGADIEAVRPVSQKLIDRVCSAEERAFVGGDGRRFLQIWTAKEAIVKHSGVGLRGDIRKISALHAPDCELFRQMTDEYVLTIATCRK